MAEVNSMQAVNAAAGKKNSSSYHNRLRALVITMPPTWTAAQNDTVASKQALPPGARVIGVEVSCAAGSASSTLGVGIRKASDATNADPDALCAAQPINAAGSFKPVTGATLTNGQDGVLPAYETEPYLTFLGAAPSANQALRVMISYIAP